MSTPGTTETMFTAAGAAKACKVGRSTVHRYLDQGKLPGAERDADGVWQIPLSALYSAGWTPGRSPSVVDDAREHDRGGGRDSDRPVSAEVHRLIVELERARAEARVHANKVQALEEVVSLYRRMLEAPSTLVPATPVTPPQSAPIQAPQVAPDRPVQGNTGKWRKVWNVLRY